MMKSRSRSWSKAEREKQGYLRKLANKKPKVTLSSLPWEIKDGRKRSDREADENSGRVEGSDKDDDKSA